MFIGHFVCFCAQSVNINKFEYLVYRSKTTQAIPCRFRPIVIFNRPLSRLEGSARLDLQHLPVDINTHRPACVQFEDVRVLSYFQNLIESTHNMTISFPFPVPSSSPFGVYNIPFGIYSTSGTVSTPCSKDSSLDCS